MVLGVLGYLVVVPLALLVLSSFKPDGFPTDPGWTLSNFRKAYGDPGFLRLLLTTLAFVVGSTALAVGVGGGLALLIERTDVYG
ncbi:MAG: carbohydrate ABC transporter permease, partial [Longimicrobiales bacterium]